MKLAILTCEGYDHFKGFDFALINELKQKKINAEHVIWTDSGVDWPKFQVALILSTWDYFLNIEQYQRFISLLTKLKREGILLINPLETIIWNSTKSYLKMLAQKGLPTLDTLWLSKNSLDQLEILVQEKGWQQCVIKPTLSGGGLYTQLFSIDEAKGIAQKCSEKPVGEWIIQPFADEVVSAGEVSFIFVRDEYMHAVLKRPKPASIFVQPIHGGIVCVEYPDPCEIEQSLNFLKSTGMDYLHARVDVIRRQKQLVIMEIEMIEPYLFSENSEGFVDRYADHLLNICYQNLSI